MSEAHTARARVIAKALTYMHDDNPLTAEARIEIFAAVAYLRERAEGVTVSDTTKPGRRIADRVRSAARRVTRR